MCLNTNSISLVLTIIRWRWNLSTDYFVNLVGGLGLRLYKEGEVGMQQAPLLKFHDVKQVDVA